MSLKKIIKTEMITELFSGGSPDDIALVMSRQAVNLWYGYANIYTTEKTIFIQQYKPKRQQ